MIKISLFGLNCLSDSKGRIIYLKNCKKMAILIYLSRQPGRKASRSEIYEMLWQGLDIRRQQGSLRQAIRWLRKLEIETGTRFLEADKRTIRILEGAVRTDLDEINDMFRTDAAHAIAKASRLVSSNFLRGFQNLSYGFASWRKAEKQRVFSQLSERSAIRLSKIEDPADQKYAALARFILRIDPGHEWAHRVLIRHFAERSQRDRAVRHYEDCQRLMLKHRGSFPSYETKQIISGNFKTLDKRNRLVADRIIPPTAFSGLYPVLLLPAATSKRPENEKSTLLLELGEHLEKNRELVVRHAPAFGFSQKWNKQALGFDSAFGGQFALSVHERGLELDPIIELRKRDNGQPIFTGVLGVSTAVSYEERSQAIHISVSEMQNKLREYHLKDGELRASDYGKLSRVYDLMKKFDQKANGEALDLLAQLDKKHKDQSVIKAFRASIFLKQNLFLAEAGQSEHLLLEAKRLASAAVTLDPWHELNQRYLGFALCNLGEQSAGKMRLLEAQRLAGVDPQQCIATAEVCAFADDIKGAMEYSYEAQRLAKDMPRYFYGYMANIQFAAENFDEAASLAAQAPKESMDYRATRIAALWQLGNEKQAQSELKNAVEFLARQESSVADADVVKVCEWFGKLVPFANSKTKSIFQTNIRQVAMSF